MQVRQGTAPHLYEVESESQADKWYQVFANGTVMKCSCKGYLTQKACKHLAALQQYLQHQDVCFRPARVICEASSAYSVSNPIT